MVQSNMNYLLNKSTLPIDTLTGTTTPGHNRLRNNSSKEVTHIPQIYRTGASPFTDIPRRPQVEDLTPLQRIQLVCSYPC